MKLTNDVVRGGGSGIVISLLVHAAAFMLAGMLVVFNVVKKEEKKFVPPKPVDRPKMKLKKPKVKVKKTSKPKSTTRIVTKVKRAGMPDIQLPEMDGMLGSLSEGIRGLDLGELDTSPTLVGQKISTGADLEGTFYSIMRDRRGRSRPYDPEEHRFFMRKFLKSGWKSSVFAPLYRSPQKLYANMIMMPISMSNIVPKFFGESDRDSQYWFVHYKGQIVYPEDITFRFVVQSDTCVCVRVDGELVIAGVWHSSQDEYLGDIWQSSSPDNRKWWLGNWTALVGDWITLKAGEAKDIEVLIGDAGGLSCLMLAIQEEGVEYPVRPGGGPRLPAFKTSMPSRAMLDIIKRDMVDGEVDLVGGPVFNDLGRRTAPNETAAAAVPVAPPVEPEPEGGPEEDVFRIWGHPDDGMVEGQLVTRMGDRIVVKDRKGRIKRLPLTSLSDEDREFMVLSNPPQFDLSVSRSEDPVHAYVDGTRDEVIGYDLSFTGKIQRKDTQDYPYALTAEYYVIGKQRYADVYMLLDRQESVFTPGREQEFCFSGPKAIHVRKVEPREWVSFDSDVRGEEYFGYLMVIKDKRGEIIAHNGSSNWFLPIYDRLRNFPVNGYLNKSGDRVDPKGPKRAYY